MKNQIVPTIKNARSIIALGLAALLAGCSSTSLVTHPVTTHVVQVSGKLLSGGVVMDPVTGQNTLGYKSGYVTVTTIPVSIAADTNGVVRYLVPEVATSFEVAGKNIIFGSAGTTYTLATGDKAVGTLLGGQHLPVNEGFYGTNNVIAYAQPATVTAPVPTVTATTSNGTNSTSVTTPIVLKP
jgi:hypothetical protein